MRYTLIGVSVLSLLVGCILLWRFRQGQAPQLIALDDTQATYTIIRQDDTYLVHYVSSGEKVHESLVGRDARLFIASSPEDLEQFIEKPVKLEGTFVNTDQQCIQERCLQKDGSFVGLEIHSIQLR